MLDGLARAAALVELHGDPLLEILDAVAADAELYQVKGHAGDLEPEAARINAGRTYAQATVDNSALDDVHRQPALAGLLVLLAHVEAGLAHGLDRSVERHEVLAVALGRQRGGVTAFTAPSALRSMQGTWTKPATGSQVMPR